MSLINRTPARAFGRKVVPWLLVLEVLRQTYAHWQEQLTAAERKRLTALLKATHGRPGTLSKRETQELRELTSKLDLFALGKRTALSAVGFGGSSKR